MEELNHIIGKRVCVNSINLGEVCGVLQFIGYNKFFPSWGLVCTIDRLPGIQIKDINSIKLIEK